MKTFKQFQEEIKNVPSVRELGGLGGGGGGTDSITDKSPAKSIKKRVIDAGKLAPFTRKRILSETSFWSIARLGKLISTSKKLGRTPPPSSLLLNVSRVLALAPLFGIC